MAQTEGDEQIAAMRTEIRRAGASVARRRAGLRWAVWGLLGADIAILLVSFIAMLIGRGDLAWWDRAVFWPALLALAPLLVLALLAFPVPSLSRRRSLKRLRHRLAPLSREALAEILVPLRHDPQGDARHLAASLAGQLGLPAEVTPATAPDARGDEASPR